MKKYALVCFVGLLGGCTQSQPEANKNPNSAIVSSWAVGELESLIDYKRETLETTYEKTRKGLQEKANVPVTTLLETSRKRAHQAYYSLQHAKKRISSEAGGGIDPKTHLMAKPYAKEEMRKLMMGKDNNGLAKQIQKSLDEYVDFLNKEIVTKERFEGRKFELLTKWGTSKNSSLAEVLGDATPAEAELMLTSIQSRIIYYEWECLNKFSKE